MKQTSLQEIIENQVTKGRGFNRNYTSKIPSDLMDKEVGLQIALRNMNSNNKGADQTHAEDLFNYKIDSMIKRFKEANIPLEVITTAESFKFALAIKFNYSSIEPIIYDTSSWMDTYIL